VMRAVTSSGKVTTSRRPRKLPAQGLPSIRYE
jgi:hypothetical protein